MRRYRDALLVIVLLFFWGALPVSGDVAPGGPELLQRMGVGGINQLTWLPGRNVIAVAAFEGIGLLDLETGRTLRVLQPGEEATTVAVSPEGQLLAGGDWSGGLHIWDIATETRIALLEHPFFLPVTSLAFSPDGRFLASGYADGTVLLWSVAERDPVAILGEESNDWDWVQVAFSPNGRLLATGGEEGIVRLWNVPAGTPAGVIGGVAGYSNLANSSIQALAFGPSGNVLAGAHEDGAVRFWDVSTGRELATLLGHEEVTSLSFSPNGDLLAVGSAFEVHVWSVADRRRVTRRATSSSRNSVAFSPNGRLLASGGDDGIIRTWEGPSWREGTALGMGSVNSVAFDPKGRWVASGSQDGTVRLWTTTDGEEATVFRQPGEVRAVAFSPVGEILASGGEEGTVRLWNVLTGAPAGVLGEGAAFPGLAGPSAVNAIAFSPDGRLLASGSEDGAVRLWLMPDGVAVGTLGAGAASRELAVPAVNSVAFSSDGRFLAGGYADGTIQLWDVQARLPVALLTGHFEEVTSVAFSPKKSFLVSGSLDGTLRLWSVPSGELVSVFTTGFSAYQAGVGGAPVLSVAFSPDGQLLASGHADGTIWIRTAETGAVLFLLQEPEQVNAVAFSPDSSLLATGDKGGLLSLWEISPSGGGTANRPPRFERIEPRTVSAGETLSFELNASDPDGDPLRYSAVRLPVGAQLIGRRFTWTPSSSQLGEHQLTFQVTDLKGGTDTLRVTVTVLSPRNRAPVFDPVEPQSVRAGEEISFSVVARDPDGDPIAYSAVSLPPGAQFDPATRRLNWQPTAAQVGEHVARLQATDGRGGEATLEVSITVLEPERNRPPAFDSLPVQTVQAGESVTFQVLARDPDGDPVTYSARSLPRGAQFNPTTRRFSWVPELDQVGTYSVTFRAQDPSGNFDELTVEIVVERVNLPPRFDPTLAQPRDAFVGRQFLLVIAVQDPEGGPVTLQVEGLPEGAGFNPATRTLQWTPTADQLGSHQVLFVAQDQEGAQAQQTVTIRVGQIRPVWEPVELPPAREGEPLSFRAAASHPEGLPLTLDWESDPSLGATVQQEGNALIFNWTPGYDAAGSYQLFLWATDTNEVTTELTLTLVVENTNRPPEVRTIPPQEPIAGQEFRLDLNQFVVEPDPEEVDALRFFVGGEVPQGLTLSPSGELRWTPTEGQAGEGTLSFSVQDPSGAEATGTVRFFVQAPPTILLNPQGQFLVREGETRTLEITAPDANTGDTVTLSLVTQPAAFVQVASQAGNPARMTLTVSPGFADAQGQERREVRLIVQAEDNSTSRLHREQEILLIVENVNRPPQIAAVSDQSLREGDLWTLTVQASDPDPDDRVTLSVSGLPRGMSFDSVQGRLSWRPDFDQAGEYVLTLQASDGHPDGETVQTVHLTVEDVNRPPSFQPVSLPSQMLEGSPIAFTLRATDPDPDNTLRYRAEGLPPGATLDPSTGAFRWTPPVGSAGQHSITFTVEDGRGGQDTTSVTLVVLPLDQEPPEGSIEAVLDAVEEGGRLYVGSPEVELRLSATDNRTPPEQIQYRLRVGTGAWSPLRPMGERATVSLTGGDGEKTISARFQDALGNISEPVTVSLILDTRPPELIHTPPTEAELTRNLSVEVRVSDLSPVTGRLYFRPGGEVAFREAPLTRTGDLLRAEIPSGALRFGVAYYVQVSDLLGHESVLPAEGAEEPYGVAARGTFRADVAHGQEAWLLFSVPLAATEQPLQTTLSALVGPEAWRAQSWNGRENVPVTPEAKVGGAFWLITRKAFRYEGEGTTLSPAAPAALALRAGWNLVASPYPFPVPLGNLMVRSGGGAIAPLLGGAGSDLVRPKFWEWQDTTPNDTTDGDYQVHTGATDVLEPWKGYWVFADAEATLLVPPFRELRSVGAAVPSAPLPSWVGRVEVLGPGHRSVVRLALAVGAQEDYDPLDVEQPPLPSEVEWSLLLGEERFQQLALPEGEEASWEALLRTPAPVRVRLLDKAPAGYFLYGEDLSSGERHLLSGQGFVLGSGEHRLRLRLSRRRLGWDVEGVRPWRTELLPAYPNPFNPEVWVPFALSESSAVEVWIYDLRGEVVRRLSLGWREAGRYSDPQRAAYWDGRNELGEPVGSGVYLVVFRAGSFAGVRRIVLRK